jgi:hypothetical protein
MVIDNKDMHDKILDISEDEIMHGALVSKSDRKKNKLYSSTTRLHTLHEEVDWKDDV